MLPRNKAVLRQQNYTSLRAAFRSENGAIDLASIMVGIIVIGLIGGVIAATVFAVIPWAQDNAAKQQLDSIHTAENASYGLSADPTVTTDQTKRNMFTDSLGLETAKLLAQSAAYCVVPSADGKDYTAYVKSASGKIWTAMNSAKKATVLSGTPTGACSTLGSSSGSAPVVIPATVNGGVVTTFSSAVFYGVGGLVVAPDNSVYVSDSNNSVIKKIATDGTVTVIAGSGVQGFADGQGAAAQFATPYGLTLDSAGNLYVADYGNHRIRKITPSGLVSTVIGTGDATSTEGNGSTASISYPMDVVFDAAGNLYATDYIGQTIRKMTPAGVVSTFASLPASGMAMDIDSAGNLYLIGSVNSIIKVTPAGVATTIVSGGTFYYGLAVEFSTGIVYISENRSIIQKLLPNGTKTTIAGTSGQYGNVNGTGAAARFNSPTAIALDASGALIVGSWHTADTTLRKVT